MRFHLLASDYDGTLATDGHVDADTEAAMQRLRASGRRLLLVTGRELPELLQVFPQIEQCDLIVAENGALLYNPATKEERALAPAPPKEFVRRLRERGVERISVGRVIVATWEPYQNIVLDTIREMGLELQVIFNKGAVMVLPAGVNKAFGLAAALKEISISPHNVVGVGDAENDHALLRMCEVSVAVSNALAAVKDTADFVTTADHGKGVSQLIDAMVNTDLAELDARLTRHYLPLGMYLAPDAKGSGELAQCKLPPYGSIVLVAGPTGSGKTTITTAFMEALAAAKYQFCVVDPEGDYEGLESAVALGSPQRPPLAEEIQNLLTTSKNSLVVALTGMALSDRPSFFATLFSQLLQMQEKTARPHWLVLDEAHHLLPATGNACTLPIEKLPSCFLVTVNPELLASDVLKKVNVLIVTGEDAASTLNAFALAAGQTPPEGELATLNPGEALVWMPRLKSPPVHIMVNQAKTVRRRHRRKYAEGALPPERSFYFRGAEDKLNLRAQNLIVFLQLAEGIDDETWQFHLRQGSYSQWFRESIKDPALAAEAEVVEQRPELPPAESRRLIRAAIENAYTLPASPPLPAGKVSETTPDNDTQ